jgi:serine/threonine-protein kinase
MSAPSGGTGHRPTRRERELDERRRALPQVLLFFTCGWLGFSLLDLYVALVIGPATPFSWFLTWRLVGGFICVGALLLARRRSTPAEWAPRIELTVFASASICLSLIAVRYGGLGSHYLPGLSLVTMVQTLALPSRWWRSVAVVIPTLLTFPVVMGIAALFEPSLREMMGSQRALAVFGQDYLLVLATGLGCSAGGHLIWAWRRQVYHARRLGRYRLKARIGWGGMGEVWLASDASLKRDVAVKILANDGILRGDVVARFEREAQAASSLRSPHTIRIYDFGASEDGVWFIAMEYLDGANLGSIVYDCGPMPAARAIRLVRQACASLAEAHAEGIVHRDIKPDNLFVTRMQDEWDFVKLLDFGIAKVVRPDDPDVTQTGVITGTPAYMSPEVCGGGVADTRSDIYSLGAVLYHLVTGTPPFNEGNSRAVMLAHVNMVPQRPSARLGQPVSPELEAVILRCLAKLPQHRYERVEDLDAALAACEAIEPPWTAADARAFWAAYRPSGRAEGEMSEAATLASLPPPSAPAHLPMMQPPGAHKERRGA